MKAFHGKKEIKEKYVNRVLAHQKADEIRRGFYWKGGKGCAVGCTVHSNKHKDYEIEIGIPEWLAQLQDKLFEGMSLEKSKKFPAEFLKAIGVGADLEKCLHPFLIVVVESALGEISKSNNPKQHKAICRVLILLKKGGTNKELLGAANTADAADAASGYAAAVRIKKFDYLADQLIGILKNEKG